MFGPFLDLMLNALDTGITVVVLLALWDGHRTGRVGLFPTRRAARPQDDDVARFVAAARRLDRDRGTAQLPDGSLARQS